MKKPPKFMICKNEMVSDQPYILHTQYPQFIAKVDFSNSRKFTDIEVICKEPAQFHYEAKFDFNQELGLVLDRATDWLKAYSSKIKL